MELQYKLTYQDWFAAQALHARRGAWPYITHLFGFYGYIALGPLIWAWGLGTAAMRGWANFDWGNLALGALFIGLSLYIRFAYRRLFRRTMSQSRETTLNLDADLVRCQGEHSKSEMEWAAIKSSAEDKKSFLLYLVPGKFLVVPKRVCSGEQVDELRVLLQEKLAASHENRL
jgi:hypothetical protein